MGAAGVEEVGELALGEQGVGGEGAAAEVEPQVLEHGDDGADFVPTACGRRALGLVVGCRPGGGRLFLGVGDAAALADGAEDVDLVLVSADLAHCGLGVVGGAGAVAVPGAGFGLGLRVVGVDGAAHGLAVDGDGAVGDGEHRGQRVAPALAAAGVVDVGEAVGQRTHGVGGDHGFRASVAVGGVERGAGQARPRRRKGVEVDIRLRSRRTSTLWCGRCGRGRPRAARAPGCQASSDT